jgi:hypothetical protein
LHCHHFNSLINEPCLDPHDPRRYSLGYWLVSPASLEQKNKPCQRTIVQASCQPDSPLKFSPHARPQTTLLLPRVVWLASTSMDRSYSSARTHARARGRRETPHRDPAIELRPPRSKPRTHRSTPQPEREPLFGVVTPRSATRILVHVQSASRQVRRPRRPIGRPPVSRPRPDRTYYCVARPAPAGGLRPRQPTPTARVQ